MIIFKRCPARLAFVLELPLRQRLMGLPRLVDSLPLRPGMRVLDLGCGSGVVAKAVAERVTPGQTVLMDAQPAMLDRARRRFTRTAILGSGFVAGAGEFLPFAHETFDLALMVTVLGEVDDAEQVLHEVRRVLRPGGCLSISEHLPDPDFRSLARVRSLMRPLGFVERAVRGGRWSYTANFEKAPTSGP